MYWCARISKPVGTPDIAGSVSARARLYALRLLLSRVRVYEQVAGSPATTCSLIFADYLKSKSFYLSERMELSNDPRSIFQPYIRLASSSSRHTRILLTCTINVLFAGAARGRRSCSASDLPFPVPSDRETEAFQRFPYLLFERIAESVVFY